MTSNFVILSLFGFLCFQAVQCQNILTPIQTTMLPISPSIFYDDYGSSILSRVYPYYNFYSYRPCQKLIDDYDLNKQLALYSAIYNVPIDDLYQLENIIDNNMPLLPSNLESSMIQDLARAIQNERIRDYTNPFQYQSNPSINPSTSLTMAQLMGYLPSDFPPAYLYMLNYLDSLLPCLSPDALAEIQNAVYSNTPSSMLNQADDLTFQLQSAIRYMQSNLMYFVPNY